VYKYFKLNKGDPEESMVDHQHYSRSLLGDVKRPETNHVPSLVFEE
jgi:hypothetical protein